jgi:hypothetical protein
MHRSLLFAPRIGVTQRNRVFDATHATAHVGLGSAPGAITSSVKIRYFCIAGARLAVLASYYGELWDRADLPRCILRSHRHTN